MEAVKERVTGAAAAPITIPVTPAVARLLAALPAGVAPEALNGPWVLSPTAVRFDVSATGGRRVLIRTADTVTYAGTLYDEPVTIEQAHLDDINAWLARVQLQYGVKADGVLPVYGALINVDATDEPTFYTVAQRAAGSLASVVLAPYGVLAPIDTPGRLRLAWQTAGALTALHARGLLHGAVTPANVLLSSADEGDAAVRVVGYNCTSAGTGSATDDVHDWGMLAWRVFASQTLPDSGPPPMTALVNRGVPAAVVEVVRECLSTEPGARPTMAAVAHTLAAALVTAAVAIRHLAPSEPQSASAAAARDVMLQLAVRAATRDDAEKLVGGCGAAASTLRAFVTDVAVVRAACAALRNLTMAAASHLQKGGAGAALAAALLAHTSNAEVLLAACDALHNLAAQESARGLLVQCDCVGVALVAALRSDAVDVAVARTVCATLKYLAAAADHALALQHDGCGVAVIATLQRYVDNAEVAAAACGALSNLAAADVNCSGLERDGAGAAVLAALQLHVTDANAARNGCAVLKNLTASKECREALLARCGTGSDGCAAVVAAVLKRHANFALVANAALHTLWNISVDGTTCVPLVRDYGAAAAVVAALKQHANNVEVVRAAYGTLRNLATEDEAGKLLLCVDGVGDAMVAALQRHTSNAEVAMAGCLGMRHLAAVEVGRALLTRDATAGAAAVAVLKKHVGNASVAHVALEALWNISTGSQDAICESLVCDHAAGAAIVAALQRHADNVEVARAACGTLRILGESNDACEQLACVDNIGVALVAAMQRHAGDTDVAAAGSWGIRQLATVEGGRALLARDGSAGAELVAVLKQHIDSATVVHAAMSALREISDVTFSASLVRDKPTLAVIVAALRRHMIDVKVARMGCGTISNLAAVENSSEQLMRVDNLCDTVVAVLQQHVGNAGVQADGCWALYNIAFERAGRELLAQNGNACAAVAAVLKQHVTDASVAGAALNVIWNMSIDETMRMRLLHELGVMPAMVAAFQLHVDNRDVVRGAFGVLCNLLNVSNPPMAEQPIVETLATALLLHGSDADMAGAGCWALCRIVGREANSALVVPAGLVEVVVGLLQRHVGNVTVVTAACNALWALAHLHAARMALANVEGAGAAVLAALQRHVASGTNAVNAITRTLCYLARYCCLHATLPPLTSEDAAALRRIMAAHPTHLVLQLCCDDALTLLH